MDTVDSISTILDNLSESVNFSEYEDEIMKPLTYLSKKPSKFMFMLFAGLKHWLDVPKDKLKLIEEIYEYLFQLPEM